MGKNNDIRVLVDRQEMDIDESALEAFSINYKFEDPQNFQEKQSSELFSLQLPATNNNNQIIMGSANPAIEDLTKGQRLRNIRSGSIMVNGIELLVGKAICNSATHTDKPESYDFDFYGNNADWIIPLKEATLFDFVKDISFNFTLATIENSWSFDGRNPALPYVFAPVRYTEAFGGEIINDANETIQINNTVLPTYLRPSLSVYFIIMKAFKSIGYRIKSDFFEKNYFRRLVMPWTWGDFLLADKTRSDNLAFRAKGTEQVSKLNVDYYDIWDCKVTNTSSNGGFDNNGVYSYDATKAEMKWTYLPTFDYGKIRAWFHFEADISISVAADSYSDLRIYWYKNKGTATEEQVATTSLKKLTAPTIGKQEFLGMVGDDKDIPIQPGDTISAVLFLDQVSTSLGRARIFCEVKAFEFDHFTIEENGRVDLSGYPKFKDYKFLDFFAGILDLFNISPQTDPVNKQVLLEPQHEYSLRETLETKGLGYYNSQLIDWEDLQDLSKKSILENFSDCERNLVFRFKEDSNDGIVKIVQKRNAGEVSRASYLFPNRFKAGKGKMENRFFSPVMHADIDIWKGLGSDPDRSPQMVCIVDENTGTTSGSGPSETAFEPKVCYYKGISDDVGWSLNGETKSNYPFMFAVNYQPSGEKDPILSYCDELIGENIGYGLLRRFYLQRLAIMRNGQYYKTFIKLNNNHVANWFHRELIKLRGQKWELNQIKEYRPLLDESTEVYLKKYHPILKVDSDNVYPSSKSVKGESGLIKNDLKYTPAKALKSDIPNYSNSQNG